MARSWSEVETDLLENVFYAHDPAVVLASTDLARDDMLDSLTIVAILETLAEAVGDESAFDEADVTDFRNIARIRALYEKAALLCVASPS